MSTKKTTAIPLATLATLMAGSAIPVVAQPYETERSYEYSRTYQNNSSSSSSQTGDSAQRDEQYREDQNNQNSDGRYDNPPPPEPDDRYGRGYDRGFREGAENERYRHDYRATDADAFYRDCRQQRAGNQAGGLIIGAIAGGLIGNAISGGRGPGTVLGASAPGIGRS